MLTSMDMHGLYLDALLGIGAVDVRLVARLSDPIVGGAEDGRVTVYLPDMHIVSTERLPHYSYHTNHIENAYRVLMATNATRAAFAEEGASLDVIQLGDLYDLFRDGHGIDGRDSVLAIAQSYPFFFQVLANDPRYLRARCIVGNHDAWMRGSADWYMRLMLPSEDENCTTVVMHGDLFDWFEQNVSVAMKEWGLYLIGKAPQPTAYPLAELEQRLKDDAALAGGFRSCIKQPAGAALRGNPISAASTASSSTTKELNVLLTSAVGDAAHEFLPKARDYMKRARRTDDGPGFPKLRLMVIGHTHHARIVIDDAGPDPFVLMDCGGWIESYREPSGKVGPNCQIGVVAGNDIRIYQLEPR